MRSEFVFTRLYLPRPIEADVLAELLTRLAGTDVPRPLVFETRADDDGIQHLLGIHPTATQYVKRLLRDYFGDVVFDGAVRPVMRSVGRIQARITGLPLGRPTPESLIQAIHGALEARQKGESVCLQAVLGRSHSPQQVRSDAADPLQTLPSTLWNGKRTAQTEIRRRLQEHASDVRVEVTLRVGINGPDADRRAFLARSLFGALRPLESIGVALELRREPARQFHEATAHRSGLQLSTADLLPLLGWPIGDRNYPGVEPLHPKRLPVPTSVTSKEGIFAIGTAPGPKRPVGITPEARLSHLGVLAPTGVGKSEAILAPLLLADVTAGRPVILVDPKAQLVEFILDTLDPTVADRVVVFDPSDPDGTAGLNPLDVGSRDPYVVVDSIMAVFKRVFDDGWGPRTEDILHASLLTLALDGSGQEIPHTLLDLPALLTDATFRRSVVGAVADEPEIARFWARYEAMSPQQRESIIAAPMNKLRRFLMRRNVAAILGQAKPAFRLRDVFKTDKVVLVALNDALVGPIASQLIGGLICAEVFLAAQERAGEKNPRKRPGFVYVDEVASFLHLPLPISTALEVSRSFGVGWALFGQGRYQLDSSLTQAFEINTRNKLTFATSPGEARDFAKHTPGISADDIQALPKYEVYANVMTADGSSGWFSARTLPPPARHGHGEAIRAASRRLYSAPSTPAEVAATPRLKPDAAPDASPTPLTTFVKRRRS